MGRSPIELIGVGDRMRAVSLPTEARGSFRTLALGFMVSAFAGLAGCGGVGGGNQVGGPSRSDSEGLQIPWVQEITPFEVLDEEGRPYVFPFLGGFEAPRPQLVDIDGDGDDDLFIQEESNRLLFFEAVPAPPGEEGLRYIYRPERFADLDIGEWYRFADADGDGNPDLLAEQPFSYLRLYRNVGGPGAPDFELLADTLRDTRGAAIFSDRQNIPNVADIDCDGRLDLLIGRLAGTISRYEATDAIGASVAPFRHVTDRFGNIEIVADPAAEPASPRGRETPDGLPAPIGARPFTEPSALWAVRPTLHGANTMALVDIDSDGDVDLFWGDFFEPGLLFIENVGTCTSPDFVTEPVSFPSGDPLRTSGYNAPTFGDLDGDGDLDLLVGVLGGAYNPNTTLVENLIHLSRNDDGAFEVQSRRFISQIDVGSESVPTLVDLDGDGDLDLVVGSRIDPNDLDTSTLYWFENRGEAGAPQFRWAGALEVAGAYHAAPAFGDLNGDGRLDLLLGTWGSELRYFTHAGEGAGTGAAPGFSLVDSTFVTLTRGSNATPTLGDLDGDGDLDLVVGEASGNLNYYENVGDPSTPRFRLVSDEYAGIDVGRRSVPVLVDLDGDGDLDLVIGSEADGLHYYENRGDATEPEFVEAFASFPSQDDLATFAAPTFGDLDLDGVPELIVGGAGGGLRYFGASAQGDP